ncbi:MAG: hypothetical protein KBD31_04005 [Proteobacteria bacterium]|nr:hypothetical protein [Pseudomonadota bacterium]
MTLRLLLSLFFMISTFVFCSESRNYETVLAEKESEVNKDFPNYFKILDESLKKRSLTQEEIDKKLTEGSLSITAINKAIRSILQRIEIPYVDAKGGIQKKGFFKEIEAIAKRYDQNAKVYVYGGGVRSLLSYIYAKLYKASKNEAIERGRSLTEEEQINVIRRTFVKITAGILDESYETYQKDRLEGKFNEESFNEAFFKDIQSTSVLGVGSDLDICFELPEDKQIKNASLKNELENFINSARRLMNKKFDETKTLENSFLPNADVKEYREQLKESTDEGGSSLDWFAFPLEKMADIERPDKDIHLESPNIEYLKDFVNGVYQYLPPVEKTTPRSKQKQTVRGFRALLEIPFLTIKDDTLLRAELLKLKEASALEQDAQKQIEKMNRNGRFDLAHNRFYEPKEGTLEHVIATSLKKFGTTFNEFLGYKEIATRTVDKGGLKVRGLLMPLDEFMQKYTANGILLHGTPGFENILSISRNGLWKSKKGQGISAVGPGIYTTPSQDLAKDYAKDTGMVLEIPLNKSQNLRVLDWQKDAKEVLDVSALSSDGSVEQEMAFQRLFNEFDIDIIINTHVIVQNSDVLKLSANGFKQIQIIYQKLKSDFEDLKKGETLKRLFDFHNKIVNQSLFEIITLAYPEVGQLKTDYINWLKEKLNQSERMNPFQEGLALCLQNFAPTNLKAKEIYYRIVTEIFGDDIERINDDNTLTLKVGSPLQPINSFIGSSGQDKLYCIMLFNLMDKKHLAVDNVHKTIDNTKIILEINKLENVRFDFLNKENMNHVLEIINDYKSKTYGNTYFLKDTIQLILDNDNVLDFYQKTIYFKKHISRYTFYFKFPQLLKILKSGDFEENITILNVICQNRTEDLDNLIDYFDKKNIPLNIYKKYALFMSKDKNHEEYFIEILSSIPDLNKFYNQIEPIMNKLNQENADNLARANMIQEILKNRVSMDEKIEYVCNILEAIKSFNHCQHYFIKLFQLDVSKLKAISNQFDVMKLLLEAKQKLCQIAPIISGNDPIRSLYCK